MSSLPSRRARKNYRLLSLTLIPGKVIEQLILEVISRHVKKKVVANSQHGFMKEKIIPDQPDSLLQPSGCLSG